MIEIKGPLLASRGFATLSLAFFGYDDLPKSMKNLDFSYFEEAAEWLSRQPQISREGIGVMSVSSGSQFLFMLAIHRKDLIKAIVAVSPFHGFAVVEGLHYKGETLPMVELDYKHQWRNEKGYVVTRDMLVLTLQQIMTNLELLYLWREFSVQFCSFMERLTSIVLQNTL